MKHKPRWVTMILIGLLSSLLGSGLIHAQSLDNGVYTVDYTVLKAENDSASMANDYWEKPARITVQDGKVTIQMTVNHSKWVTEFKVPAGSSFVDTKVISTDEGADKRTVEFAASGIEQPILSKIHVTVAEIDYDHDYSIRFVFKMDSLKLIQAAQPATTPEPPVEKPPAATEQPSAGTTKPSAPAESSPAGGTTPGNTTASSTPPAAQQVPPKAQAGGNQQPAAVVDNAQENTKSSQTEASEETPAVEPVTEPAETTAVEPTEEVVASENGSAIEDESAAAEEQSSEAAVALTEPVEETDVVEEGRQLSAAPASSGSSSQAKTWLIISIAIVGAGIIAAGAFLIYRRRIATRQA